MNTTTIEKLACIADFRGVVFEPLGSKELQRQNNVHLVLTQPGRIRGNHYHKTGTEVVAVVGPALARIQEAGEVRDIEIPGGEIYRFVIPPGVTHAFQNTGSAVMLLVAFNTAAHDPASPDTVRETLIDNGL